MRNKNLVIERNRAIKQRYDELKSLYKHTYLCLRKMKYEFWLSENTIKNIVYRQDLIGKSKQIKL